LKIDKEFENLLPLETKQGVIYREKFKLIRKLLKQTPQEVIDYILEDLVKLYNNKLENSTNSKSLYQEILGLSTLAKNIMKVEDTNFKNLIETRGLIDSILKIVSDSINQLCVYFLYNRRSKLTKIGYTSNLHKRYWEITNNIGSKPELIYLDTSPNGQKIEKVFHEKYREFRKQGEWFAIPSELLPSGIHYEAINYLLEAELDQLIVLHDRSSLFHA